MSDSVSMEWLSRLQDEVGSWSEENFGTPSEQPAPLPMIGAGEEMGELTRSVLKREQGIDDSDKYSERDDVGPAAEKDAVGDVVIYVLDMVHRSNYDTDVGSRTAEAMENVQSPDDPVDAVRDLYSSYGLLVRHDTSSQSGTLMGVMVGSLLAQLVEFCELRGYDFRECVVDAWEEVSDREWDADVEYQE